MIREEPSSALGPSTVINIGSETVPRDYVTWSTFNLVFMNWCCLGFLAYVYSVKSRDRKLVRDVSGAQAFASTAKNLNIAAVAVSTVMTFIFIILYSTGKIKL